MKKPISIAAVALTVMALMPVQEAAALTYGPSGVCPIDNTVTTDCNFIITFNADGSITTGGIGGNYDGSEDALIGVINNTASIIHSFNISGSSIFSLMDGDGIDTYTFATNAAAGLSDANVTALGADGYGGQDAYFTNVVFGSPDSGTVNFLNGIAAFSGTPGAGGIGGMDYFSLEESIDLAAPPVITPGGVPEPATLALMALGLFGMAALRRRQS